MTNRYFVFVRLESRQCEHTILGASEENKIGAQYWPTESRFVLCNLCNWIHDVSAAVRHEIEYALCDEEIINFNLAELLSRWLDAVFLAGHKT